jgi:hypothetical protein
MLDFPNSPTVGQLFPVSPPAGTPQFRWDGTAWSAASTALTGAVRYDTAQALTTTQQAQARANTGDLKKNYILNGAMQVSQENGANAVTTTQSYPIDQFVIGFGGVSCSTAQTASVSPAGSPNRLAVTVTAAHTSVASTDQGYLWTKLEGLRVADLKLGTAAAKQFVLQFGVNAPAGTYSVVFSNSAFTRSYVAEYTITAGQANTDTVVSISITGDLAGTWLANNGIGLNIFWALMTGSTYAKAAGAWGTDASTIVGSVNQFNLFGTNGNVFQLFDVGLYEGSAAPTFQVPDFTSELSLCKRYWQKIGGTVVNDAICGGYAGSAGGALAGMYTFPVEMRSTPAVTFVGTWGYSNGSAILPTPGTRSVYMGLTASGAGQCYYQNTVAGSYIGLNARM